jgi:trk system potassium uptake protein TrkH
VTTTGFASADYMTWGGFAVFAFFLLTYLGGCTGSTSGGIKMLRLQIVYLFARAQVMRQLSPHRVVPMKFEGRDVGPDVGGSVLAFIGIYVASIVVIGLMLSAMGLDFITALSGAAQAIGNIGPGLGPTIGPAGNFASLPDAAKWLLGLAMLLGRLELMTVLVLLTPAFWRH